MIEILLSFVMAVLALLIIPGPDMALVIANGAAYGKRGAFFSSLGISSGGMVLAMITAIIVATAVSISATILTLIQLAGCLYLLHIAIKTIYPKASNEVNDAVTQPSTGNLFLRGVITNLSNPKALIFFTAFIPQFIPDTVFNPPFFAFILGSILCLLGFIVNFMFGVTGTILPNLHKVAWLQRTWSQWIIFMVFVTISILFLGQLFILKALNL